MASNTDNTDNTISSGEADVTLTQGDNEIPALSLGESGFTGLTVLGGQILEECSHELRWPECINTYKRMAKDGAIAPALELVEMMIARVPWTVTIPEGYEDELKDKANFVRQCMNDMDHSWQSFIKQAVSFNRYGFCVNEKVYRYRTKEKGSKYNDGLIGIKKLPIRSQDSVSDWVFKNKGRELAGLNQEVILPSNSGQNGYEYIETNYTIGDEKVNKKFIPRKKFLLFRNNPLKDSPSGTSSLNGAWQAWKYKQSYQEAEALATAHDANGFKVLYLPPQYMTADASDENKQIYEAYQTMLKQASRGELTSFILPLIRDENGNKMFEFDIKSVTGQKNYNINEIIGRYTQEILTALFADFLSLGSSGSGSFSLAEAKVSIVEMAIQAKLDEIKDQLNHDLLPQLFSLNGWSLDVMPIITYGEISKPSLDEVSKWIQRVSATGNLPKNREVINWVLATADIPYRIEEGTTQEELNVLLGTATSRSGDGMQSGMGNGTGGSSGSSGDSSVANGENT